MPKKGMGWMMGVACIGFGGELGANGWCCVAFSQKSIRAMDSATARRMTEVGGRLSDLDYGEKLSPRVGRGQPSNR